MSRPIDSNALSLIKRALNLGAGGEQTSILDDGHVSQILEVAPAAARGLTIDQGIGWMRIMNTHTGVGTLQTTVSPYTPDVNVAGGINNLPFPAAVPVGLDLFLLGFSGFSDDATDWGSPSVLKYNAPLNVVWKSKLNTAGAFSKNVSALAGIPLGSFHNVVGDGTGSQILLQGTTFKDAWIPVNMRIPRNATLTWVTNADTAGTVSTIVHMAFTCVPVGLAPDYAR